MLAIGLLCLSALCASSEDDETEWWKLIESAAARFEAGSITRCEAELREALEIAQRIAQRADLGNAAVAKTLRMLQVIDQAGGPWSGELFGKIAGFGAERKEYELAELSYRKAETTFREAGEKGRTDVARCLRGRASMHVRLGNMVRAEGLMHDCVGLLRTSEDGVDNELADALLEWADLLKGLGRLTEAEAAMGEAKMCRRASIDGDR